MKLSERIENLYLNILRIAILVVATLTLGTIIVTGILTLTSWMANPPQKPEVVKFDDRVTEGKKTLGLDGFLKDQNPKKDERAEQPTDSQPPKPKQSDPFNSFLKQSAERVFVNFNTYLKIVKGGNELNKEHILPILENFPNRQGYNEKSILKYYWETLLPLSEELSKRASEFAKMHGAQQPEIGVLHRWHDQQVRELINKVSAENQERLNEYDRSYGKYLKKKASAGQYGKVAGGAFGSFLIILLTFTMVKIERNLRPIGDFVKGKGC